jgi:hypothetical protein
MKYVCALLAFLTILSCSGNNWPEKDSAFYEVNKGKVNHLTIRHYYAKEEDGKVVKGDPNSEGEMDQTVTFDDKGYISQIYFYGETDSLDLKLVRDYNDKHLCIGETRLDANDNVLGTWVWYYDDNNNNIERAKVLEDGALFTSLLLYYDDDNNLIAQKSTPNPESGYFDSTAWVLDDRDRQIEEYSYNYYGKYDSKKVSYDGNGELPVKAWIYNRYDELSYMLEIRYNDKDLVSYIEQIGPDSTTLTTVNFDYTYDDKGNWISKTVFYDDVPRAYEERSIIYY